MLTNTVTKKRTEYSDTFKAEAVAKLKENNNNVTQTAKELGIPMNTLKNWQRKANPHCQNSCHPHLNNLNEGKGDNHGTIQSRTQTSNIKQTAIA